MTDSTYIKTVLEKMQNKEGDFERKIPQGFSNYNPVFTLSF